MQKKKVPIRVVLNPEGATYILTATTVQVEKVSTGSKVVSCLFAYCAGTEDKANTSVHLTDDAGGDGTILWSYCVAKQSGGKNRQKMAEAIADHLKKDYLQKKGRSSTMRVQPLSSHRRRHDRELFPCA
jgi:hypothetical protein